MRFFASLFVLMITIGILGTVGVLVGISHYGRSLPDYKQLSVYEPPNLTRFYAGDGRLLAEHATEKRVFVPIDAIPKQLINAFLAAEDRSFYQNPGVDFMGIARAAMKNVSNQGGGLAGGSTITQQVVKNFLLGNEKTIERKIKEAILSFRISKAFSKDRILELYLNEIYLGRGSYGVAAAALNYFNKSIDELSIEEAAMLAAMPKAPARFDPAKNHDRAKERRDWVIRGMHEVGYITEEDAKAALATPITLRSRDSEELARGDFFSEEVRRQLMAQYGADMLYKGGLVVHTTLDPRLQRFAEEALLDGLTQYDMRHGYRGPIGKVGDYEGWAARLATFDHSILPYGWHYAVVLETHKDRATIGVEGNAKGFIRLEDMKWARRVGIDGKATGGTEKLTDVVMTGDVIAVAPYAPPFDAKKYAPKPEGEEENKEAKKEEPKEEQVDPTHYMLRQIPEVGGATVVIDPHTGRVLALVGGLSYAKTEYNRATQAKRQPGSAFKTFVYLTALANGYSPTSIVVDGPISLSQGAGKPAWTPENYSHDFLGPTTLRVGLEKSRNAMTVRLALAIGLDRVIDMSKRFGIYDDVPRNFSIVLGASETTVLRLTAAYAEIVNGGKKMEPSLVERIQDRYGKTIYRRDARPCEGCQVSSGGAIIPEPPVIPDTREEIIDPQLAYQMTSILTGVVERGTATRAKVLGRPLGGKTGTTNDSYDAWFVGFSPDLVVGTFVGYDKPRSLGAKETGGSVALPVFVHFMAKALEGTPAKPFRVPTGVRLSRIDIDTGQPAGEGSNPNRVVVEAFRTTPTAPAAPEDPAVVDEQGLPGVVTPSENEASEVDAPPPAYDNTTTFDTPQPPVRERAPTVGTGGIY